MGAFPDGGEELALGRKVVIHQCPRRSRPAGDIFQGNVLVGAVCENRCPDIHQLVPALLRGETPPTGHTAKRKRERLTVGIPAAYIAFIGCDLIGVPMKRVTEVWLVVFGLICAGIGVAHLLFGSSSIIGGGSVNATIDSDLRFYALLFSAYGLTFVWCAADIGRCTPVINALGAVFFIGGVARLLSWAVTGRPNWFYVLMIPVELLIPLANYALVRRALSYP